MVWASGQFKQVQIRQLNYCCMYLQAVTISDITRANGMKLDMSMHRPGTTMIPSEQHQQEVAPI